MTADTHPGLERARLLMRARRWALAEAELRRALAEEPDDARLHATLALCLSEDPARADDALRAALQGTVADPLAAGTWYALSLVQHRAGALPSAEQAARIAVGRAPEQPGMLLQLGRVLMAMEQFRAAMEPVEQALALAPDDDDALMLAGTLASRLGRHDDARAWFARALAAAPDDHAVHGNAGWAALRRGDAAAALTHFRVSLRLDASEPAARRGMLEAMRARNPAYRIFLRAALRLYWIPPHLKWLAIGLAVMALAWISIADLPAWFLLPVQAAVVAAAAFTWTARPLADLALLRDPLAAASLDAPQRTGAAVTGALVGAALVLAGAWQLGAPRGTGLAALLCLLFTIPAAAATRAVTPRHRRATVLLAAALTVPAALALVLHARQTGDAGLWLGLTIGGLSLTDLVADPPVPRTAR